MAEILTSQVDLPGLMTVLGNHLYSTPEVAVRELVQNAHDSCVRRQLEDPAPFQPRIRVALERQRLIIQDNGAGLTRAEIIEYLATVGRGYTGKLRAQGGPSNLIGAFGLGFLSAYFVARVVELHTVSYQCPEEAWHFTSKGSENFILQEGAPGPVGTRVELHLNDQARALGELAHLHDLLSDYCGLLSVPIELEGRPINLQAPWREPEGNPLQQRHRELEFARQYERKFRPLCVLPVPAPGPLQGLLWIQDGWSYGTSDHRNLSVYVRGMLISHDSRDLLPEWAGIIGGVVESAQLTPTASREDLQRDAVFGEAQQQLRRALVEGLAQLAERHGDTWQQVLQRHSEALLGAALCEPPLFDLLAHQLRVPTSEGDLTAPQILQRSQGKMVLSLGRQGGYEEVLFRALRQPVVLGVRYGALAFCSLYCERRGGKLVQLGTAEGNRNFFRPAQLPEADDERLRALFAAPGQQVVLARFQPASLPVVLVPDREVALKKRVQNTPMNAKLLTLVKLYTDQVDDSHTACLYVNLDCPLIGKLLSSPRAAELAVLLRCLGELMSSRSDDAVPIDASQTLEHLSQVLDRMCD